MNSRIRKWHLRKAGRASCGHAKAQLFVDTVDEMFQRDRKERCRKCAYTATEMWLRERKRK